MACNMGEAQGGDPAAQDFLPGLPESVPFIIRSPDAASSADTASRQPEGS